MIKNIFLTMIFVLMFSSICSANALHNIQSNIGEDKIAHFGCSFVINHICRQELGMNRFWSAFTTLAIGAAKEAFVDDHWDSGDMIADGVGVLVYQITW